MTPSPGLEPYARLPTMPEMSTTPSNTTGIAASVFREGLAEEKPRDQRDENDLRVAENGAQPGADRLDRVMPELEVGDEEQARGGGEEALAASPPSERTVLDRSGGEEERDRERASVERAGRGETWETR